MGDEIPEYLGPKDTGLILTVIFSFFLIQSEYGYNCQDKSNGPDPYLVFPFRPETFSLERKEEIKRYLFIKGDFLVAIKETGRRK